MNKLSLLIVDDDVALCELTRMTLSSLDIDIQTATSRQEAMDILEETDMDVMVLDMGMPPKEHSPEEGLSVLQWLDVNAKRTKVIVLTGQDREATSYKAIRYGAFDFVTKPCDAETIKQAVERAVMFADTERDLRVNGIESFRVQTHAEDGVKVARNLAEEKLFRQVLAKAHNSLPETARLLNIKRENAYYLLNKYGIDKDSL